jgi:hypothetical protein
MLGFAFLIEDGVFFESKVRVKKFLRLSLLKLRSLHNFETGFII